MLSYDIRELQRDAVRVEGDLAADDAIWTDGDERPVTAVHATGRLSRAGGERFYWSGRIEGTLRSECRRCLREVDTPIAEDVHVLFAPGDDLVADDPDAYRLPRHAQVIDLRPAVREQWILGVPGFVVCTAGCRGICPHCGADLNAGPCNCPAEADPRWEALRSARGAFDQR